MVPPLVVPLIVSQFWRGEGGLKGLVLDGGLAAFRVGGLASAPNPPVSAQPRVPKFVWAFAGANPQTTAIQGNYMCAPYIGV